MRSALKNGLKNLLFILASGYILLFYSEHLFWAHIRSDDSLINWMTAWLAYSLLAYMFLFVVDHFRVRSTAALFLAGAVFGWLTEGVVVQTTYESLPLSISFTGLAWHALISVMVGWYMVRRVLRSSSWLRVFGLACLIGLIYGLWAVCWWLEPDGKVSSLTEFSIFTLTITALVMIAYAVADWSASVPLVWNRWITAGIAIFFLLYFIFIAVPAAPIALLVLPVLLGLAYLGLRRNHAVQPAGSWLEPLHDRPHWWNYLALVGLPLTAILFYGWAQAVDIQIQSNWLLYLITTPLGFVAFVAALIRTWRFKPDR